MSDFKFACNNCSQHIAVDVAWCGQKVVCPSCQADLVIPAAPPPVPGLALSTPPPIPRRQPAPFSPTAIRRPVERRLCILAPVALLLVVATPLVAIVQTATIPYLPLSPACLLAGLICSHIALRRINRSASLSGKPWALVGMCLGYVLLLFTALGVVFMIAVSKGWITPPENMRPRMGMPGRPRPTIPSPAPPPSFPQPGGFPQPGRSGPRRMPGPQPGSSFPRQPLNSTLQIENTVGGTLAGQPFICDRARLLGSMLELRQGRDFIPDTSISIFMIGMVGDPSGKTLTVPPTRGSAQLTVRWRENGRTKFSSVQSGYTLRVEFGQKNGDLIPGKIELEIPGTPDAKIAGEFTAELR